MPLLWLMPDADSDGSDDSFFGVHSGLAQLRYNDVLSQQRQLTFLSADKNSSSRPVVALSFLGIANPAQSTSITTAQPSSQFWSKPLTQSLLAEHEPLLLALKGFRGRLWPANTRRRGQVWTFGQRASEVARQR